MTDKYKLELRDEDTADYHYALLARDNPLNNPDNFIARIYCIAPIAKLIDNALNATSRAGQSRSQAKREASKRNGAKRWQHVKTQE